nr:MAG TPA: Nuclease SbcCD subunit C, Nuclease, DNA repair, ABC-type ATPase [Caudoviricetes sp.]
MGQPSRIRRTGRHALQRRKSRQRVSGSPCILCGSVSGHRVKAYQYLQMKKVLTR